MNPYRVLNLTPGSTKGEIRRAYKRTLLKNHPDTCKGSAEYTVDQINEAYKSIQDTGSPSSQNTAPRDVRFSDVKDLSELAFDEENAQYFQACRCGQEIVLAIKELEENGDADEIAIQCSGCSLWVLVQYEVDIS